MSNFPCPTDLTFYQERRAPVWAKLLKRQGHTSIDTVVNAHAGVRLTSAERAVNNLLAIMAGYRRRGEDLGQLLVSLTKSPGCAISPAQSAAFARKWALRLGLNPAPHIAY